MGKEDFKNAAAKLLAQHAARTKRQTALPTAVQTSAPTASETSPAAASVPRQPERTPVAPAAAPEWEDACSRPRQNRVKWYIVAGLALAGCAVTVLLVPETIFGIAGNATVGLLTGAGLGMIINREF